MEVLLYNNNLHDECVHSCVHVNYICVVTVATNKSANIHKNLFISFSKTFINRHYFSLRRL